MTTSNDCKKTIGEELFLVYLKRRLPEEEEEDLDLEPHRRVRSRSIGQELYEVHLKRSQGMEEDCSQDVLIPDSPKGHDEIKECDRKDDLENKKQ
jgi:hypothetical protein|eukprot:scaffold1837_cov242-Chaetoceros_neogracile.AAC.1